MSDPIEREDAINEMADYIGCDFPRHEDAVECARSVMEQIPSARPKEGEWIWNENGMDWGIGCWCCSECGMRNPYIGSGDNALLSNPHNWAGSKYCPNCGADMSHDQSVNTD